MNGGYIQDYGARHHPLKTFNKGFNIILGRPQGGKPLNRLGRLKIVLLKLQSSNLERRLALKQLRLFQLKSITPTLGLGLRRPSNQAI
jgi:hypothetical protein